MFVHHPACACYLCALIDTSWLWHVFTDIPTTDVFFSGNKKCKYSIRPRHEKAPYLRKNYHDSFLFPHSVWKMACATKPIAANLSQSKIRFAVPFLPCVNFIKKSSSINQEALQTDAAVVTDLLVSIIIFRLVHHLPIILHEIPRIFMNGHSF